MSGKKSLPSKKTCWHLPYPTCKKRRGFCCFFFLTLNVVRIISSTVVVVVVVVLFRLCMPFSSNCNNSSRTSAVSGLFIFVVVVGSVLAATTTTASVVRCCVLSGWVVDVLVRTRGCARDRRSLRSLYTIDPITTVSSSMPRQYRRLFSPPPTRADRTPPPEDDFRSGIVLGLYCNDIFLGGGKKGFSTFSSSSRDNLIFNKLILLTESANKVKYGSIKHVLMLVFSLV